IPDPESVAPPADAPSSAADVSPTPLTEGESTSMAEQTDASESGAATTTVPDQSTQTDITGGVSTSTLYYAHVTDGVVDNLLIDPDNIIPTGALGDPSTWIPVSADVGIGYTYDGSTFAPSDSQKALVFVSSTSTSPASISASSDASS